MFTANTINTNEHISSLLQMLYIHNGSNTELGFNELAQQSCWAEQNNLMQLIQSWCFHLS